MPNATVGFGTRIANRASPSLSPGATLSCYSGGMTLTHTGVQPTSIAQQRAWHDQTVAEPEEIAAGLWAVCVPMPGDKMPSTLAYAILGSEGVCVIDPGWSDESNLEMWEDFLKTQGRTLTDIQTILITHSHIDHIGLADLMREASGAEIVMSAIETEVFHGTPKTQMRDVDIVATRLKRWGVPDAVYERQTAELKATPKQPLVMIDRVLHDGETITVAGRTLRVMLTPGHTTGHMCFIDESSKLIFTGDHVLPGINPGLGLGSTPESDPVTDYFSSLQAITQFDDYEVLPGHEFRFRGLADRSEYIAAHHLRRTRAIATLVPELGDAPVWEYASRSPWTRGWGRMEGFILHSALTQTELHLEAIRSGRAEPWLNGEWANA